MLMAAEQCNIPDNPPGSCVQDGYVCRLAIDVRQNQKVMAFYLYDDAACTQPSTTDALAMTLAGSVALSAYNNRTKVSVIYTKHSPNTYGGLRLNSISTMP